MMTARRSAPLILAYNQQVPHQLTISFGQHPCGFGAPLFLPLVRLLSHLLPFLLFPFFHWLYLFSSLVRLFPFYQNSPTPFPGRRSWEATEPGFNLLTISFGRPPCGFRAPFFLPPYPFTFSSFALFTFPFLSLALPIFFYCPSLPFLPE